MVGAPRGTYPGGLSGLPALDPVERVGLVYICPVASGECGGLVSNDSDVHSNDRRLFDGDRKYIQKTLTTLGPGKVV